MLVHVKVGVASSVAMQTREELREALESEIRSFTVDKVSRVVM